MIGIFHKWPAYEEASLKFSGTLIEIEKIEILLKIN
jgi:hypothetical protein